MRVAAEILHEHMRRLVERDERDAVVRSQQIRQAGQCAADDFHAAAPAHARRSIYQQHQVQRRMAGVALPCLHADVEQRETLAADGRRPAGRRQAQSAVGGLG